MHSPRPWHSRAEFSHIQEVHEGEHPVEVERQCADKPLGDTKASQQVLASFPRMHLRLQDLTVVPWEVCDPSR